MLQKQYVPESSLLSSKRFWLRDVDQKVGRRHIYSSLGDVCV